MIRTRDFAVYILLVLFLVVAIIVTVYSDLQTRREAGEVQTAFNEPQIPEVGDSPTAMIDYEANRKKMRLELQQGNGVIEQGEPVLEAQTEPEADTTATTTQPQERTLAFCPGASTESYPLNWPRDAVVVATDGASRVVTYQWQVSQVGTTTVTTETQALLVMPMTPVVAADVFCLPDAAVGITSAGALMHVNDGILYQDAGDTTLLGYARDGFPIYGPVGVELDSCGGRQTANGYQYHVRIQEPFLLACFSGKPQPLTLP